MEASRLGELALVALVGAALGAFAWFGGGGRAQPPSAPAGPAADDGVPSGMVAFFAGGVCPAGWEPASGVAGRLVVGVPDGGGVGKQVGAPLSDQEDRTHGHLFSGDVTLASKGVTALSGNWCSGANPATYTLPGSADVSPSGLPFIQMAACLKP
jgi:hypothetical protein